MSRDSEVVRFDTPIGVEISGHMSLPPLTSLPPRGVVILCHGFSGARYPRLINKLTGSGFAVLAIDFPGYGESDGDPRRIIPSEQVSAVRAAADYLDAYQRNGLNSSPYALLGSSLGGSIALLAAAEDRRFRACVASCPLANGRSVLQQQYGSDEAWGSFEARVKEAKASGSTLHRFEVVYIPEHMRGNLPADTPMEFVADTAEAFMELSLDDSVRTIRDVPILFIHARDDEVVPMEESLHLAGLTQTSYDLELPETGNHFILGSDDVAEKVVGWLQHHIGGE